jgi:hypothetical protein
MLKMMHIVFSLVAALAVAVVLNACGGTTSGKGQASSGKAVAQVGNSAITAPEVNHWMQVLTAGDYVLVSHGHPVPAGLVSEPPNYGACAARLEAAAANAAKTLGASAAKEHLTPTPSQLLVKCQQLYQAIKLQAIAYLVNEQWVVNVAKELGVTASAAEVTKAFDRFKTERFPKGAGLDKYLAERNLSLPDEMVIEKLDVLGQKLQEKMRAGGQTAIGSLAQAEQKWAAKTSCPAGYVFEHCQQYHGQTTPAVPSQGVLLEQVAAISGVHCVNRPACG